MSRSTTSIHSSREYLRGSSSIASTPPYDVLYYLFSTFLNDTPDNETWKVVLSGVNRYWRYCALQTVSLWTTVTLHCNTPFNQHNFASLCFKRSQSSPLILRIDASRNIHLGEVFNFVLPYADRFEEVAIRSNRLIEHQIWERLNMRMPNLVHALSIVHDQYIPAISDDNHVYEKNWASTFAATRTRPGLGDWKKCEKLTPFRFGGADWSSLKSTQLTALTLRGMPYMPSVEDMYHILSSSCTTLKYLELWDFLAFISYPSETPNRVVFSCLETLKIGYNCTGGSIYPYMQFVHAPNLVSFSLRDFARSPDSNGRPYLSPPFPLHTSTSMCSDDGELLLDHFSHCTQLREVFIAGVVCGFLNDSPGQFVTSIQDTVEKLELRQTGATFPRFSIACLENGLDFGQLNSLRVI